MRSVVFAYQDVGFACLDVLLDLGAEIAAVFTHDDDPGEHIWFRSVRQLAEAHDLPVFAPERLGGGDWLDRLRAWDPDFIFSFYYRRLLPAAVLETARRGAFNLHGSLLPKYRGRCPVNWVLIHGERETGVTLHHMVAKADAGDIVAQRRVPIAEDDTAATLYGKLTIAAAELLRATYPRLLAGTAPRTPQDHSQATTFGGRTPADGLIDWTQSARQIANLVRAVTHPYPGALTHWRGMPLLIWQARVDDGDINGPAPGTVVQSGGALIVQTGGGRLCVQRVQLTGEDECNGDAWARRHGVAEGMRLT
jgi:UDP-4-amino-4-deoxy-L-arabinose formyltransferase/UDP-glucuronic acid dehydrogenase (UDP-4-keto-hexauronic acid decarboxylating)